MNLTGFDGLDAIAGGLQEKKNYLLYGNIGTGKTTFSLQFLYQGLISGDPLTAMFMTAGFDLDGPLSGRFEALR